MSLCLYIDENIYSIDKTKKDQIRKGLELGLCSTNKTENACMLADFVVKLI